MRLLLVHTGGTLMMRGSAGTPLAPDVYTRDLVAELPVLRKIAEIETLILHNLDSSDLQPHHWVGMGRIIHDAFFGGGPRYDGAVIIHGTDTMRETAAVLGAANLGKTIVLTGAMIPYEIAKSDALFNLGVAVGVAKYSQAY